MAVKVYYYIAAALIEQLADESKFTLSYATLLLNGELPTKNSTKNLLRNHSSTMLDTKIADFFQGFRFDAHPMAMLCGVVGAFIFFLSPRFRHH